MLPQPAEAYTPPPARRKSSPGAVPTIPAPRMPRYVRCALARYAVLDEQVRWTENDIPGLAERRAIVTGANSGIGWETARALAARGAEVTLAVRDTDKGEQAARQLRDAVPSGRFEVRRLDLADLASVDEFAWLWREAHPDGLDLLINNAGVMAIPRRETADGFRCSSARTTWAISRSPDAFLMLCVRALGSSPCPRALTAWARSTSTTSWAR